MQKQVDLSKIMTETYELTEECLNINYYGAKRMVDAFIGLLQTSDSPTIVNVSSSMAKLEVRSTKFATSVIFLSNVRMTNLLSSCQIWRKASFCQENTTVRRIKL